MEESLGNNRLWILLLLIFISLLCCSFVFAKRKSHNTSENKLIKSKRGFDDDPSLVVLFANENSVYDKLFREIVSNFGTSYLFTRINEEKWNDWNVNTPTIRAYGRESLLDKNLYSEFAIESEEIDIDKLNNFIISV